jgi:hypothetical protein
MKFLAVLVAVVVLASCDRVFGPTGRDGDAGVDGDANVGLDVLIDTPSGRPVHPAPLGDDDRDGILNQSDGCPLFTDFEQYNEDGDCFNDDCDLCPHLAADGQDNDSDGIGDACDIDGFDVGRFDSFHDADEILAPIDPGWTLDSVLGTFSSTTTSAQGRFAWMNTPLTTPFLIDTQFAVPPTNTAWNVGVVFGATGELDQTPDAWFLVISREGPAEAKIRLFRLAAGLITDQNMDQSVSVGTVQQLRVIVAGRSLTVITNANGGVTHSMSTLTVPGLLPLEGDFGIGVIANTTVTFDYLWEVHHR